MFADLRPILAEIRKLPRSDWERVIKILTEDLSKPLAQADTPEETAFQQMAEAGFLTRAKRKKDLQEFRDFKPIEIQGQPLSETIIEMRQER